MKRNLRAVFLVCLLAITTFLYITPIQEDSSYHYILNEVIVTTEHSHDDSHEIGRVFHRRKIIKRFKNLDLLL